MLRCKQSVTCFIVIIVYHKENMYISLRADVKDCKDAKIQRLYFWFRRYNTLPQPHGLIQLNYSEVDRIVCVIFFLLPFNFQNNCKLMYLNLSKFKSFTNSY